MSEKNITPTNELAVIGSIGQLLRDHAEKPFEGVFSVAIRDGGYSTYYGGLPTEPDNAAECWLMVLEASKILSKIADQVSESAPPEKSVPEKPSLTLVDGGKGSKQPLPPASSPSRPKGNNGIHPKPGQAGKQVSILKPHTPTPPETWTNPDAVATVVPGGAVPESINGIPFTPWENPPTGLQGWDDVEGQNYDVHLDEPEFEGKPGKSRSAGVIVEEPDGRVWVVHPTNAFGGYKATFAKGGLERLEPQAAAIKEAYEESGLKVEITGLVGDIERSTTVARYYLARRVGGTPSDMGWESQAVSLVPRAMLSKVLNQPVDHKLLAMLNAPIIPAA